VTVLASAPSGVRRDSSSVPTTMSSCERDGFVRLDAGEIDAFELDELIHRYKRSARELWKFCGSSGSEWERAAGVLAYWREHGEEPDWWEAGAPRHSRG
jgi:hypothetical protein